MSEHNYLGLIVKENLEKHPEIFAVTDSDVSKIEQTQAVRRAAEDAARPTEPVKVEYGRLRKQIYDLQQWTRSAEQRVLNESGNVHHFEKLVADMLKAKKNATISGHLGEERHCEHRLVQLETELQDARERLVREQKASAGAARELRNWQAEHGARLAELQKIV